MRSSTARVASPEVISRLRSALESSLRVRKHSAFGSMMISPMISACYNLLRGSAAQNTLLFKFPHARGRIAELAGQKLLVVLAEKRGLQLERLRKVREAERESGNVEIAEDAIVHRPNGAALAQ